jgi:hypothetical protein
MLPVTGQPVGYSYSCDMFIAVAWDTSTALTETDVESHTPLTCSDVVQGFLEASTASL